jgi:hypothetical protein
MVNAILSDELQRVVSLVFFEDPDSALRERDPQLVLLCIRDLYLVAGL